MLNQSSDAWSLTQFLTSPLFPHPGCGCSWIPVWGKGGRRHWVRGWEREWPAVRSLLHCRRSAWPWVWQPLCSCLCALWHRGAAHPRGREEEWGVITASEEMSCRGGAGGEVESASQLPCSSQEMGTGKLFPSDCPPAANPPCPPSSSLTEPPSRAFTAPSRCPCILMH